MPGFAGAMCEPILEIPTTSELMTLRVPLPAVHTQHYFAAGLEPEMIRLVSERSRFRLLLLPAGTHPSRQTRRARHGMSALCGAPSRLITIGPHVQHGCGECLAHGIKKSARLRNLQPSARNTVSKNRRTSELSSPFHPSYVIQLCSIKSGTRFSHQPQLDLYP